MSTLGWVHLVFALVALAAGTAVILIRKGTRWHRTLGHVYLTCMLAVNITALFIYIKFGVFGPFHWMAIASLLTLLVGMVPVFTRRPKNGWLRLHAGFISGSYVGLVAAAGAETAVRLPGTEEIFGLVVGITTVLIIGIGVYFVQRHLPKAIEHTPARFRKVRS